jgi:hypothetical protein
MPSYDYWAVGHLDGFFVKICRKPMVAHVGLLGFDGV